LHARASSRGSARVAHADLLVFLVDGRYGPCFSGDTHAQRAARTGVPVLLGINKTDDSAREIGARVLRASGFDPVLEISAEHGTGVASSRRDREGARGLGD